MARDGQELVPVLPHRSRLNVKVHRSRRTHRYTRSMTCQTSLHLYFKSLEHCVLNTWHKSTASQSHRRASVQRARHKHKHNATTHVDP
jgi:hypothetical protein